MSEALTSPHNIARVKALREAGLTLRQIAGEIGASYATVWRLLHLEQVNAADRARNEYKRRWDRDNYRGNCAQCGDQTWKGHRLCQSCYEVGEMERVDALYSRIEEMWGNGFLLREIAAELGTTVGSLGVTMVRMRERGYDLPYRYKMRNGRRIK